ncbi:single-stranded DNA-binding protein [Nothobranchius furzeri]|uniref:Glycine-rich RNA-binding protein blt801-like n=1 Tax=Nothobranchius furzeri TaxID=105023 RepID=A0A1A8ANW5_NOTFU|nr:glycine-rich RNA-binding protein blt801-like [Nothobranchius furzeri]
MSNFLKGFGGDGKLAKTIGNKAGVVVEDTVNKVIGGIGGQNKTQQGKKKEQAGGGEGGGNRAVGQGGSEGIGGGPNKEQAAAGGGNQAAAQGSSEGNRQDLFDDLLDLANETSSGK